MSESNNTREYLSVAVRRERLLDAAADVVAESGGAALTLRRVAERAGVAHRVVNYAFGSKDELVVALLGRESRRIMTVVWEPALAEVPLERAVERALTAFVEELSVRPSLHRGVAQLTAEARSVDSPGAEREAEAYLTAIGSRLAEWCERTGATLTLPMDIVATTILVAADGLASWWLTTEDDARASDVIATLARAFEGLAVTSDRAAEERA